MRRLVCEPNDLVLDRRTIARSRTLDMAPVHRRPCRFSRMIAWVSSLVCVMPHETCRASERVQEEKTAGSSSPAAPSLPTSRWSSVKAWRRPCLQPAQRQPEIIDALSQAQDALSPIRPAGSRLFTEVDHPRRNVPVVRTVLAARRTTPSARRRPVTRDLSTKRSTASPSMTVEFGPTRPGWRKWLVRRKPSGPPEPAALHRRALARFRSLYWMPA